MVKITAEETRTMIAAIEDNLHCGRWLAIVLFARMTDDWEESDTIAYGTKAEEQFKELQTK